MRFFRAVSGRAVHPKILGLNVGIFGTIFGQSGTNFRTVIGLCVLFLCVIAEKKKNNMLVV